MMTYYYDSYGNYTPQVDPNRSTEPPPPVCESGQPNWTGSEWVCLSSTLPSNSPPWPPTGVVLGVLW